MVFADYRFGGPKYFHYSVREYKSYLKSNVLQSIQYAFAPNIPHINRAELENNLQYNGGKYKCLVSLCM